MKTLRPFILLALLVLGAVSQAFGQGELTRALRQKLPSASQAQLDRAASQFMDHLREIAPMAADSLAAGRMDADDLASRLDVFLDDHPELTGRAAQIARESPRDRVADALKAFPDIARSDVERNALADRFISGLPLQSSRASDALRSGRITDDELQARVAVFAGDVRSERSRAPVDPAEEAAPAVVDAYEKANFSNATDRPDSVCFKGEVDEGGKVRQFIEFQKRPDRVRLEIVEKGLVVGILAYDGATAWRELAGRAPVRVGGAEARRLSELARTFDPFFQYQERGAIVRVVAHPENGPIRLSLKERDGTEMEAALDGKTYAELSRRFRQPDGTWNEVRLGEFRKFGPLNFPCLQQEYKGGALRFTTRITDVRLDPGLIDAFFAMPAEWHRGFMDYMAGLAILETPARTPPASSLNLGTRP